MIVVITTKFFFPKTRKFLFPVVIESCKELPLFLKAGCKDNPGILISKSFSPLISCPIQEPFASKGFR